MTTDEIESSLLTFGEQILGFDLYHWQARAVVPFDGANNQLVQVSLATPNGSGKSAVVIPVLVLGWLAKHRRGRVVLTTADGRQLDGQVMPAIQSHRSKFPAWTFVDREVRTPTGGRFVAFTTDQAGRAEGWHKGDDLEGPLLIIVDEAKTVAEDIFSAIDRCTYNAILLTSSPGGMAGRFYESQVDGSLGFVRIGVGLKDCPHITQDKVDRIVAQHGPDSPFTRSTLHGEFMAAEGEARFDFAGLEALREMAVAGQDSVERVVLLEQEGAVGTFGGSTWPPPTTIGQDSNPWLWMSERPMPGGSYLGFCDPMTGEQSAGSKTRDTHAAGILRAPYVDAQGVEHDTELVAALYVPSTEENSGAACRWDNDILAARLAMLLRYYGNCLCICEANNSGTEVIRLLLLEGCRLWRREKPNHRVPGRKMLEVVGFLTTNATKNYWIGALGTAIRERTLVCKFSPAVRQCQTFILNDRGTGEAQAGCHDDWCTGLGMGIYQIHAATMLPPSAPLGSSWPATGMPPGMVIQSPGVGVQGRHGACA